MTPPNKPEWIHLAETDSAPQVKKSARALPALVLAAAMSIVGLGALVAQSGAETPAISSEQGINLSTASAPAATSAISPDISTSAPNSTSVIQPNAPQQPSIASLPTGGGDDDDDDDDEDEEDEEDDDEDEDDDDDH
jgi:hypothetical protein